MTNSENHLDITRRTALVASGLASIIATLGIPMAPPAAAESVVGGPISRGEVMARASYWVYRTPHVMYSHDAFTVADSGGCCMHRPDCSGMVAMAWHIPVPPNPPGTSSMAADLPIDRIDWRDMLPGDIALLPGVHTMIFGGWKDDSKASFWSYEQSDYWSDPGYAFRRDENPELGVHPWNSNNTFNTKGYAAYRYRHIFDGDEENELNTDQNNALAEAWQNSIRSVQILEALEDYIRDPAGRGKMADDRILGFLQQRNVEGRTARAFDNEDGGYVLTQIMNQLTALSAEVAAIKQKLG